MPAIVLVMGKKEGCNKMSKKTHFVTAPFFLYAIIKISHKTSHIEIKI